jgi:ankyrin repeat protein
MQDGWTALMWAVHKNHTAAALALIAAKADVNAVMKVLVECCTAYDSSALTRVLAYRTATQR